MAAVSAMAEPDTPPNSRVMPIMLIRLSVEPVRSSASMTPMSERGSEAMMAMGSMKLLNCTTRMKYISSTATPSAPSVRPKTSACCSTSPPCLKP